MKKQVFPKVKEVFTNVFPHGYRPWVDGWSFAKEKLLEKSADGAYKLLTLDLSISDDDYVREVNKGSIKSISQRAEKKYKCAIGCKHCFECKTDTNNTLMAFDDVKKIVKDAKRLGLETVKFLGPGELLHNPKLFEILNFFEEEKIKICIFTKGVVLGDDKIAQKYFKISSENFCEKISKYACVRLLIGLTSVDPDTEYRRLQTNINNFSKKRNRGIENAVKFGFSGDFNRQKLALICAPILQDNIDEAFDIYRWGVKRNIPVILAPTMASGKGLDMPEISNRNFKEKKLVDLYARVYRWLIKKGLITIEQLKNEGVSPYAGYACNQFVSGMFIRKDGRIQACPGNEAKIFRYSEDIRNDDLRKVWLNCMGYNIRKKLAETGKLTITQPCYAKTEGKLVRRGSIPKNFYKKVLQEISK